MQARFSFPDPPHTERRAVRRTSLPMRKSSLTRDVPLAIGSACVSVLGMELQVANR